MDEFQLLDGSGGTRTSKIIKLSLIIVSGMLLFGSIICLLIWASNLSSFQSIIEDSNTKLKSVRKYVGDLKFDKRDCDAGTLKINNQCIIVMNDQKKITYPEARSVCKDKYSAKLFVPFSDDEFTKMSSYLKNNGFNGQYWVGCEYNKDKKEWKWLNREILSGNSKYWSTGQPQVGDEYCVALDSPEYLLHDYPCGAVSNYICAYKM